MRIDAMLPSFITTKQKHSVLKQKHTKTKNKNEREIPKMKLYYTIQQNFASVGFVQDHNGDHCHYALSRKHLAVQSILLLCIISMCAFAIHVADTLNEYVDTFYLMTVTSAIFTSYTATIFQTKNLLDFISTSQKLINDG